jgi:iron complex transport system substrate-binding protein
MFRSLRATRLKVALAAVPLLLSAAACGSGTDSGSAATTESATPGAAATSGAFPVTIAHKYGETTIEAEPQRVVTVGLTDQDAVLALGKVPVGTTEWIGGYKGAIGPWAADRLGGAEPPTVLTDTGTGPQAEKIAALAPDLIVALYSGLTKEQYDNLSKIAPVIAQPGQYADYGIPWQELTTTVGKALGKEDDAKKLVADVEERFASEQKEHPEFANASGAIVTPYEGIFVYGPQDARSRVLTSLGLTLPSGLAEVVGEEFGANLSKERTDLLDTDALVWLVADPAADAAKLHKDKLYGDLKVVKEGREIFVKEADDYGHAVSFVSVLSLPYVLDRLVPQLTAALDGDPATKVTEPTS